MGAPWENYQESGPWAAYGDTPNKSGDPRLSGIPNDFAAPPAEKPKKGMLSSYLDSLMGSFEVPATLATGAVGAMGGAMAALPKLMTQGQPAANESFTNVQNALTYQPRSESGQATLSALGGAMDFMKVPPMPVNPASIPRAATMAGNDARMVGRGVNALSEVARSVAPKVNTQTATMAAKAQELGIPLRPDMLTENKFARLVGDTLEKIPLSGSKADQRQVAFNQSLTKIIGGDETATRLTPDVFDNAMNRSGGKIGYIAEQTPIPITPDISKLFKDRIEAMKFETDSTARIVTNYVNELGSKSEYGVIDGTAFRKINSEIGRKMRNTSDGDLKYALSQLQDDMQDALERSIKSPELLAELQDARRQYAIGKTIEPLVAKSKIGDISPAGLMGAVTSDKGKKSMMARGRGGDLGDLAKIGQLFMKEPPSSGTAERGLIYGGLLGGGAAINPLVAGGLYGAANVYNRAGPAITKRISRKNALQSESAMPTNTPLELTQQRSLSLQDLANMSRQEARP